MVFYEKSGHKIENSVTPKIKKIWQNRMNHKFYSCNNEAVLCFVNIARHPIIITVRKWITQQFLKSCKKKASAEASKNMKN